MRLFLTLLTMAAASFCFIAALDLKDRDAIHDDDLARYDSYMATVQGSHAIDMYMDDEGSAIKVDIYDGATDTFERTASFRPSAQAPAYFAQLEQRAQELLGADYVPQSTKRNLCSGNGPDPNKIEGRQQAEAVSDSQLGAFRSEARASRCYQFCGYGSDCIRATGCTHCRYVGGACRWQKWCI